MKSLGDRMKGNYENRSYNYLTRRMPVIIRLDGKAFHTFTKGFERPFDDVLRDTMISGALAVAKEAQGFKCAYIQSDEVSILLTDYDQLYTEAWFDYRQSKIETVAASAMTAKFNREMHNFDCNLPPALFDARAFSIPKEEVVNYFMWRMQDWRRNSIQMYSRAFFSHKELHEKNVNDCHEMLAEIGKDWSLDVSNANRNGTFILGKQFAECNDLEPEYDEVAYQLDPLINPGG